ncbi:MAG: hypothetical protein HC852_16910 [Acaryochloridaceae cyanobacterium RU_4_10]|nr:hypothetical protein [Acaryochloridaceae cyanobacterium RU_4_10]
MSVLGWEMGIMNNLAFSQQTYPQSDTSQQLNSLAERLDRIASICTDANDWNSAIELIRESQYFIEGVAPTLTIDEAAELVKLGRILAEWKFKWAEISRDPASLLSVHNLAQSWHKRLCEG